MNRVCSIHLLGPAAPAGPFITLGSSRPKCKHREPSAPVREFDCCAFGVLPAGSVRHRQARPRSMIAASQDVTARAAPASAQSDTRSTAIPRAPKPPLRARRCEPASIYIAEQTILINYSMRPKSKRKVAMLCARCSLFGERIHDLMLSRGTFSTATFTKLPQADKTALNKTS
jgi:hypothetical protein